jgi:hypothetical protein
VLIQLARQFSLWPIWTQTDCQSQSKYMILRDYKGSSKPKCYLKFLHQFLQNKSYLHSAKSHQDEYSTQHLFLSYLLPYYFCYSLIVGCSSCAAITFYSSYLPRDVWLVVAWYITYRLNSWRSLEDSPPEIVAETF